MVWICWKWLVTPFSPKNWWWCILPILCPHTYRQGKGEKHREGTRNPRNFALKQLHVTRNPPFPPTPPRKTVVMTNIIAQVSPPPTPSLPFSSTLLFPRYLLVWLSAAHLGVSDTDWGCLETWQTEHSPACVVALCCGLQVEKFG